MITQYEALIDAPFGVVAIAMQGNQLGIDLLPEPPSQEHLQLYHPAVIKNAIIRQAYEQINQYLQQPNTQFHTLLHYQHGTAFQQSVWQAIVAIPLGQVATYGQIASQIGSGPRAVANACGANNIPLIIPCHRVVAQNGIGGFMQGKENGLVIKRWLLAHEGVQGYTHE
ncbi:MAG: methylated-DNA--[protein]-cysteine S-methyltransferase [Methylotenera sp.]|nr:methylated-DNA--[protein]-cysteine S-methyltransferase [Methylotenera sp.]MDI1363198.1 methylated-DNA--[protein]-cysteine S-methyltransferase [Methylotenera sp.]